MSQKNKVVGQKIGKLTLLKKYYKDHRKRLWWETQCECGNVCQIESRNLDRLKHKSCGCEKLKYQFKPNDKIGKLTLIKVYQANRNSGVYRCWECLCDCGEIVHQAEYSIGKSKNPSCGCIYRKFNLKPGDKINKLTLIERGNKEKFNIQRSGDEYLAFWKCLCDCGKECYHIEPYLYDKTAKSCGCYHSLRGKFREESVGWKGYKELSSNYFNKKRYDADKRGLEFNVTIEYLYDLFIKQNKKCNLSGVDITMSTTYQAAKYNKKMSASLDRIDNTKGYIEGNCQWLHWKINRMKRDFSVEQLIYYCQLVIQKQWLTIFDSPDYNYEPMLPKRAANWKGYKEIYGDYMKNLKANAKKRSILMDLDIKYLWDLYLKQGRKCALSGLPIKFKEHYKSKQIASLDRIDSSKPYVNDNVWWTHVDVNKMKSDDTIDEFYERCLLITNYTKVSTSILTIA